MFSFNFPNILLIGSFILSILGFIFYARQEVEKSNDFKAGRILYYTTSAIFLIVSVILMTSIMRNDFSYTYIYFNSDLSMHWAYKISAFWAGSEGSFLLWLLISNLIGIFIIRKNDKHESILLSVFFISQILFLVIVLKNSPFQYLWDRYPGEMTPFAPIADGQGMNELLKDPWMIFHPPILFIGYASALIPFAYAIVALMKRDYAGMIGSGFKWVLISSMTLGIGIFMGGYWAYKVLGWGGYWGWDPVENSSLVPWFVVVALLHGLILQKRKGALIKTNIILSIVYFVLVLFSTYLTRSGVLANFSVHSFGESSIAVLLLLLWVFFLVAALIVYVINYKKIESKPIYSNKINFEMLTIFGIVSLLIYSAVILFGTILPIITGLFMKFPQTVNVETYYNNISIPFGIIIMVLMFISTKLNLYNSKNFTKNLVIFGLAAFLGVIFNIKYTTSIPAYLFSILSFYIALNYILELMTNKGSALLASRLSHIGVAIMVLGVISSGYHSTTNQAKLQLGEVKRVGDVVLKFTGVDDTTKNRRLKFAIKDGDNFRDFKTDFFIEQKMNSLYKEPHIENHINGDYYITPLNYTVGSKGVTSATIKAGESATIDGIHIHFDSLQKPDRKSMMNGNPEIYANLTIDKKKIKVGMKYVKDAEGHNHLTRIPTYITSEKRKLIMDGLSVEKNMIALILDPGKETVIPKDSVLVDVSYKSLIWLVWFGTVLVSIGLIISFWKKKED